MALTLTGFDSDDGTGLVRQNAGLIGRIVVVDVNESVRQNTPEICHYRRDRALFVQTRNQNRNLRGH